jgi:hypothetical protein
MPRIVSETARPLRGKVKDELHGTCTRHSARGTHSAPGTRHPAPGTRTDYVLFTFFFSPQDSIALP